MNSKVALDIKEQKVNKLEINSSCGIMANIELNIFALFDKMHNLDTKSKVSKA